MDSPRKVDLQVYRIIAFALPCDPLWPEPALSEVEGW